MIVKPIQTAHMDDPAALVAARRAAWAIYKGKPHPGYRRIGNGHFSAVFAVAARPGLVLKVGGLGGYGRSFDKYGSTGLQKNQPDAWPSYVQFLVDRGAPAELPSWAPRVYHVEALSSEFYFAVIERLAPDEHGEARDGISWGVCDMVIDAARAYGAGEDMHSGNFMLRGDVGVITDPWYTPGA